MERNVKIRMDGGNVTEHVVSSVTFGELKSEVDMDFNGLKVIIRETRHTLEDDSAQLPLSDFTLFVYPLKVKNGADYSGMGYHELRRLCIERKLPQLAGSTNGNYGTVEVMKSKLAASDAACGCNCESSTAKEDVIAAIGEIKERLTSLQAMVESMEDVTIANEVDTLAEEFEAVRKILLPFGVK